MKTVNADCFLWFVFTPCPDFCPSQSSLLFFLKFVSCVVSLFQILFYSSSASFHLFHPLLFFTFPLCPLCLCVCMPVCVHFFWGGGICLPLLAEGDYCPWDSELQSGRWLEKYLTDEEDVGTFKGSSRRACGCVCSNFERDI